MSEAGPHDHPAETVPQALGRLRVALDDAFLQASRTLGLTPQQADLLCAAMAPAAVGDLAQALRWDRSNVSHLVDRAAAEAPPPLAEAAVPRPGRRPGRWCAPVPGPLAALSPHLSEHHGHPQ